MKPGGLNGGVWVVWQEIRERRGILRRPRPSFRRGREYRPGGGAVPAMPPCQFHIGTHCVEEMEVGGAQVNRLPAHRSAAKRLPAVGFEIEWLPAYDPDLNPTEALRSRTKYADMANFVPDDT